SGRSLRATSRLSFVSDARYTSPIPPSPSFETTRYGPSELPIMLEQLREPFYTRGRRLERSAFVALRGGPGNGRRPVSGRWGVSTGRGGGEVARQRGRAAPPRLPASD